MNLYWLTATQNQNQKYTNNNNSCNNNNDDDDNNITWWTELNKIFPPHFYMKAWSFKLWIYTISVVQCSLIHFMYHFLHWLTFILTFIKMLDPEEHSSLCFRLEKCGSLPFSTSLLFILLSCSLKISKQSWIIFISNSMLLFQY